MGDDTYRRIIKAYARKVLDEEGSWRLAYETDKVRGLTDSELELLMAILDEGRDEYVDEINAANEARPSTESERKLSRFLFGDAK